MEPANVFGVGAKVPVGLNVYLPLQAEPIEIIDQRATHKRLYGLVKVAQLNLLRHRLGIVNFYSKLRYTEQGSRHYAPQFGALARFSHKELRVFRQEVNTASRSVLQDEGSSSGCSHTGNCRRWKGKRNPGGNL